MLKLDPYVTFQSQNQFFILQTTFPHYVGQIIRFDTDQDMAFYDMTGCLASCQVGNYRIYITFSGALQGNQLLFHPGWKEELKIIFESMAQFYLENRILTRPDKFKKFYI